MPKEGCEFIKIGDIEAVEEDYDTMEQQSHKLTDAMIIGVPQFDTYKACLQ